MPILTETPMEIDLELVSIAGKLEINETSENDYKNYCEGKIILYLF